MAYIDCMRVSERKDKIETLLNWTMTSNQDMAGFYEASALLRGGNPCATELDSEKLEGWVTFLWRLCPSFSMSKTLLLRYSRFWYHPPFSLGPS